jgi:hypothetical protein
LAYQSLGASLARRIAMGSLNFVDQKTPLLQSPINRPALLTLKYFVDF